MGSSGSKKAKAELRTIYSLSDEEQTAKIIEIIQNYFATAYVNQQDQNIYVGDNIIINIDKGIKHGNEEGKNQYKNFYQQFALGIIQGKKIEEIINENFIREGVCFKTIMDNMTNNNIFVELSTNDTTYLTIDVYKEYITLAIKNNQHEVLKTMIYILFKLGLMFYKHQIQGAGAQYHQYCYKS